LAEVALREATDDEIVAIFRAGSADVMATIDGQPVAYARFVTVDDRRWAMMNLIASISPRDVARVFYALKRRLRQEPPPVYVLAQGVSSTRLLRLLGMEPTGENTAGKDVWAWTPGQ
jgi:hypothetical protein